MVDFVGILESIAQSPELYLPVLFVFVVLATVALPIPVEVGLLNPYLPFWWLLLVLAAGRALGGWLVYPLGERIGTGVDRWVRRSARAGRLWDWVGAFVGRYGYFGLFALLSIPFMVDTATIYAFAILNPAPGARGPTEGGSAPRPSPERPRLRLGPFTMANALAGFARGALFLAIPVALGWK